MQHFMQPCQNTNHAVPSPSQPLTLAQRVLVLQHQPRPRQQAGDVHRRRAVQLGRRPRRLAAATHQVQQQAIPLLPGIGV